MIKYVKINEDVQMHGAELEHGQVYPVERISQSTGMYTIRDASNWPYEFAPGEVTEVDEIQDDSLWAALNIEPNPAPKGKFFIMYDKPENPDAPTMKELSKAQDISGYTTSFEFSLEDPNESQMLPDEEDVIGSPSHYTEGMPEGIEVRDIIKAQGFWMEFCAGNVIKYSLRWQYKNGIEDLKKMLQYGQWLVEELEDEDA